MAQRGRARQGLGEAARVVFRVLYLWRTPMCAIRYITIADAR